jgi:ELWxxDGT repeat protein
MRWVIQELEARRLLADAARLVDFPIGEVPVIPLGSDRAVQVNESSVYVTDGTQTGTKSAIEPSDLRVEYQAAARSPSLTSSRVFFLQSRYEDSYSGYRPLAIWSSDGTVAGTRITHNFKRKDGSLIYHDSNARIDFTADGRMVLTLPQNRSMLFDADGRNGVRIVTAVDGAGAESALPIAGPGGQNWFAFVSGGVSRIAELTSVDSTAARVTPLFRAKVAASWRFGDTTILASPSGDYTSVRTMQDGSVVLQLLPLKWRKTYAEPVAPARIGTTIFLAGTDGLWSSDGTAANTRLVYATANRVERIAVDSTTLTFAANTAAFDWKRALFAYNPTTNVATPLARDLGYVDGGVRWRGMLWWRADDALVTTSGSRIATVLNATDFHPVEAMGDGLFGYRGWLDDDHVISMLRFGNAAPTVKLSAPTTLREGDSLSVSAGKSFDADGDKIARYWWDVTGDGVADRSTPRATTSFTPDELRAFGASIDGKASATLRVGVRASDGAATSRFSYSTIALVDAAPTVDFTAPATLARRIFVPVSAWASDPVDSLATLTVDWGDGSATNVSPSSSAASPAKVEHRYAATGTYSIRVTAIDDDGVSLTNRKRVTIVDPPATVAPGFVDLKLDVRGSEPIGSITTKVNGLIVSRADVDEDGFHELIATDGTPAGIDVLARLKNIAAVKRYGASRAILVAQRDSDPGDAHALDSALLVTNGLRENTREFFSSNTATIGPNLLGWNRGALFQLFTGVVPGSSLKNAKASLWFTDATGKGTKPVTIAATGQQPVSVTMPVLFNDVAYFIAESSTTNATRSLYRLDDSLRAVEVATLADGKFTLHISGGRLFVLQDGGESAVWMSDGTGAGTKQVRSSDGRTIFYSQAFPGPGGAMLFEAEYALNSTGKVGLELFMVGESGLPTLLKDIRPGKQSSGITFLRTVGPVTYFIATQGGGTQLWRTDGTSDGTIQLTSLREGLGGTSRYVGNVENMSAVAGGLTYFVFSNEEAYYPSAPGDLLFRSDGTVAGTTMLAKGSGMSALHAYGSRLLFFSYDGWQTSRGTRKTTVPLPDSIAARPNGFVSDIVAIDSTFLMRVLDNYYVPRLWQLTL